MLTCKGLTIIILRVKFKNLNFSVSIPMWYLSDITHEILIPLLHDHCSGIRSQMLADEELDRHVLVRAQVERVSRPHVAGRAVK